MPSIILVCEVNVGMGHLTRMLIIASALSRHFRVVLIVVTAENLHLDAPPEIEIYVINRPAPERWGGHRAVKAEMLAIVANTRPAAVIVEHFPFGRHTSIFYLL